MRKSLNAFPRLNPELCTTCGDCTAICPTDAITLHDKPRTGGIVDKDKCISCFCCQEVCPERAIDIVPGRLLRVLKKVNLA
jgi:ferredoxin